MVVRSADARVTTKEVPQRRLNLQVLLAVLAVAGTLAVLARLPDPPRGEADRLAAHFRFTQQHLPAVPVPAGVVYPVNKTAKHMQFYFYQVGESAALSEMAAAS